MAADRQVVDRPDINFWACMAAYDALVLLALTNSRITLLSCVDVPSRPGGQLWMTVARIVARIIKMEKKRGKTSS